MPRHCRYCDWFFYSEEGEEIKPTKRKFVYVGNFISKWLWFCVILKASFSQTVMLARDIIKWYIITAVLAICTVIAIKKLLYFG